MDALQVLTAMKDQYARDVHDKDVYGPDLVSSQQLLGERRMITLVKQLIDNEISKMEEELYDI